ncbi:uncharacterized protein LOC135347488 isoform X1 [Halichondria panicea]|uniref:uncharacterized protein LOC135347488 isoform X1 n=1 Tax=Halichondria panicea TaxID=6063 RepID=UPI00312B8AF9
MLAWFYSDHRIARNVPAQQYRLVMVCSVCRVWMATTQPLDNATHALGGDHTSWISETRDKVGVVSAVAPPLSRHLVATHLRTFMRELLSLRLLWGRQSREHDQSDLRPTVTAHQGSGHIPKQPSCLQSSQSSAD